VGSQRLKGLMNRADGQFDGISIERPPRFVVVRDSG
jgi:hypothetical protein